MGEFHEIASRGAITQFDYIGGFLCYSADEFRGDKDIYLADFPSANQV